MAKVGIGLVVAIVFLSFTQRSYAIKAFGDVFFEIYGGEKATPEFRKLVKEEAKCNVCHVDKQNKSSRNPYGAVFHDTLKETPFPMADIKKLAVKKDAKVIAAIKETLKKIEDMKPKDASADAQTFGDRIKAGMLPGGDKFGK